MDLLRLAAVFVTLIVTCCCASAIPSLGGLPMDGQADVTAWLQAALDAKAKAGGGVVSLPAGQFRLDGSLSLPSGVTLAGVWNGPHFSLTNQGTCILGYGGRGQENGPPLITLHTNSTLKGVTIYYPEQKVSDVQPYPWSISGDGTHLNVIDVTLLNPYQGIDFARPHELHYIRNVYGCPLRTGVRIDGCSDIGRVENVHFNPNSWTRSGVPNSPTGPDVEVLMTYLKQNCVAFDIGRSDWEFMLNTFSYGCKVGYRFHRTGSGVTNGNFVGIAADWAVSPLLIEDTLAPGLLITNGEFVGCNESKAAITIADTHYGVVQLTNCSFWGGNERVAIIGGRGSVSMSQCNFVDWDNTKHTSPAIDARGGTLTIQACRFAKSQPDITLGQNVVAAVIMGNQMAGKVDVQNNSLGDVSLVGNVVVDYGAVEHALRKQQPGKTQSQ